ncbi:hypothetical protein B484DRAFT_1471 [Ochromonadaceae sp. CCMP2298]|nr:hypothetical protein B484DRAFT_1471 [Ochromonadaceae sp. CCMP2298]
MAEGEFYAQSVAQLRHLLLSFGLSDKDTIEKSEFRTRLLDSGRLRLTPDSQEQEQEQEQEMQEAVGRAGEAGTVDVGVGAAGGERGEAKRKFSGEEDFDAGGQAQGLACVSDENETVPPMPGAVPVDGQERKAYSQNWSSGGSSSGGGGRDGSSSESFSSSSSSGGGGGGGMDDRFPLSEEVLRDLSVREMRSIMRAYGVDEAGCLEKSDLAERLRASPRVRIVS